MSARESNLSRYAERLEVAGAPREQALVHAELTAELLHNLVTTDYFRSELAAQEGRLKDFVRGEIAALDERISGRFDVSGAHIDGRFAASNAHIDARFSACNARIDARFTAFEARLEARFAAFEARIEIRLAKMQAELFRWLFIAVFVQGGFILACLKLLD